MAGGRSKAEPRVPPGVTDFVAAFLLVFHLPPIIVHGDLIAPRLRFRPFGSLVTGTDSDCNHDPSTATPNYSLERIALPKLLPEASRFLVIQIRNVDRCFPIRGDLVESGGLSLLLEDRPEACHVSFVLVFDLCE